ncbi:MAG: hypothetical protein B6D41_10755 [Chloroflexi bacterium UTCFX4]|nr:MAG: hypothetical protein B6D41_10755 [Chloroflexi bacterium UTCFX4]
MRAKPARIFVALFLILLGAYLLAIQIFPTLRMYALNASNWPLLVVALGGVFLLAAVLTWTPRLLLPAAVAGGAGAILYWQNITGNWASWTYMWTLLPGLVGIGILLRHLMQGELRDGITRGGSLILLSAAAFLIFSSWQGALGFLGPYWPLLLVLLGAILLAQVWRRR